MARWITCFRRMNRELRGRHSEDQPAMSGVNRAKPEDIAEEGADRVSVLRVYEGMKSVDHHANLPLIEIAPRCFKGVQAKLCSR